MSRQYSGPWVHSSILTSEHPAPIPLRVRFHHRPGVRLWFDIELHLASRGGWHTPSAVHQYCESSIIPCADDGIGLLTSPSSLRTLAEEFLDWIKPQIHLAAYLRALIASGQEGEA